MNPVRNVDIPKATEKGPTSKATRTIANSQYVSDGVAEQIRQDAEAGKYAYEKTTNEADRKRARAKIKELGYENSIDFILNNNNIEDQTLIMHMGAEILVEMDRRGDAFSKRATEINQRLVYIASMTGQIEQAVATFKTMSPASQLITIQSEIERIQNELRERYGDRAPSIKLDENLIQEYQVAKTQEARDEVANKMAQNIADQLPPTALEQLNSYRHLSMLFNPRTWIKNYVANYAFGIVSDGKRAVQTAIEAIMASKNSDVERYAGIYNPFNKTEKAWYDALTKDYLSRYKDFQGKYSSGDVGDIVSSSKFGQLTQSKRKTFNNKALQWASDLNAKAMSDAPAMKKAYAHTFIGYLKSNNLTLDTLTKEQFNTISEYSFNQAREITFNANNVLANKISEFANTNKATKIIIDSFIPFKRTPLNILKQGVKYSPAQLAKSIVYDYSQLQKGKITATQFADGLSAGITGTGIVLLGALLANLGWLRTSDDDNDRKQYFDEENGEQDYAIVTKWGTYTIDWLDPIIMPLAIGAELANSSQIESVEDLIDIASSIMDPVFETSMLSGISKNLQAYDSGSAYVGKLVQNIVSNYISQYVPTILGAVARTIDDTRRTTYPNNGFIDKTVKTIANKIPLLNQTNEPYINKQGEEEKNEGGNILGRAFLNFISPGYYSSKDIDEYDTELYRLYNATGDLSVLPSDTTSSVSFDGENYKLTGKEYTQWNKTRMSLETEYVNEFIDSDSYGDYNDSQKASVIESIRKYAGQVAKEEFLTSKGLTYEDTSYENAKEALNNDLDLYQYFEATDYHNSDDTSKVDYVEYIRNLDTSDTGKNYLYDRYYGDSNLVTNVNDMDIDDSGKLAIKLANATAESKKDEDGNTISNSKALAVADAYADAGVLKDVFSYIEANGLAPSDLGLTKTIYKMSYEELASKYQSVWGETFGTGESVDLASGKTSSATNKKSSSRSYSKSSSKSSSSSKTSNAKISTSGLKVNTSGSSSSNKANTSIKTNNSYDNAYASVMGTVNRQSKKDYGQSESQANSEATTYCNNCGNVVTPVNGRCPVCGANL